MAIRKNKCKVIEPLKGRKPVKCGMTLDADGNRMDRGPQLKS